MVKKNCNKNSGCLSTTEAELIKKTEKKLLNVVGNDQKTKPYTWLQTFFSLLILEGKG